jgi:GDP-4-dehydro-6-deoxy-D-mannose reductase
MPGTVLITGAAGFVGGFLTERYADAGWQVHGTVHATVPLTGERGCGSRLHTVDLLDEHAVLVLLDQVRPDLVFHLAAQSSVSVSRQDPLGTLRVNAAMQRHVLEAALSLPRPPRVVVTGSSDEYGNVPRERNPIAETQELLPVNPYALSKVVQDLMGYEYFAARDLPVIRVRPFLQLGPRRSDRFAAGSFARQVAEISAGMRSPRVEVGTIDLLRDFTDVRDVAAALELVGEQGEPGEAYNIASGRARSLRDLLEVMLGAAGCEAEIRISPHRQRGREAPLLLGDASRLRARTGWEPRITFEQSARDTLRWWQQRLTEAKKDGV